VATKIKVESEKLRGLLNNVTDVASFFLMNKPLDVNGKSLQEDIGETLDIAKYLVDNLWDVSVWHDNETVTVDVKDLEQLLGSCKHMHEFFGQYLSAGLMEQVGGFLDDMQKSVESLDGFDKRIRA
jgi:hypothetical protein